jgi:hypothetical protein
VCVHVLSLVALGSDVTHSASLLMKKKESGVTNALKKRKKNDPCHSCTLVVHFYFTWWPRDVIVTGGDGQHGRGVRAATVSDRQSTRTNGTTTAPILDFIAPGLQN